MADTITDNRAQIHDADSVPSTAPWWVDLSGNVMASGNLDTEIFLEGTGSITETAGSTRAGIFWEYATTQDLSSNHIYLWVNCGVVGLLSAKASQGMTFRIYTTDPTTDYAEWDIGGNDSWPPSIQGGWTLFCIDLESTASRTSGTPPSTAAVLGLGISFITDSMPRMVNNTWMDALYSLADGVPACIVEGQNGGVTPWTWADLPTELGVASGVAQDGPGGTIVLNGPIEFFADDATDHEFASTNETVLFADHEFIATDFYGITVLGAASGTADFKMGIKTGTGDDATGSQGGSIIAGSADVRWFWDSDIANIDTCNMYGVQLIHGGDFQIDSTANSWISCAWIDCTSATVSNAEVLSCTAIDANTADGVAFMTTDDLTDIVNCTFEFSDGHAVELTTPRVASQTSKGNTYTGYGSTGTNDAVIYNNTAGAVTIGVLGGDTPTYRNGTSATTTIENNVTVTIGGVTEGTSVKVIADETVGTITAGDVLDESFADVNGESTFSFAYESAFNPSGLDVIVRARNAGIAVAAIADNGGAFTDETLEANSVATNDMNLLPAVPVADDAYYFGHTERIPRLRLDVTTALTGTGNSVIWEYYNGSTWATCPDISDGTDGFETVGDNVVAWSNVADGSWGTTTINSQGPFFYVRARLDTTTTVTAVPKARKVQLDTTKYLPYVADRTIVEGTGLSDIAAWQIDNVAVLTEDPFPQPPPPGDLAILVSGGASNAASGTTLNDTINLVAGANRKLVVWTSFQDATGTINISCTYDGNTMNIVGDYSEFSILNGRIICRYYDVPDVDTGSKTISMTVPSARTNRDLSWALIDETASGIEEAETGAHSAGGTSRDTTLTNTTASAILIQGLHTQASTSAHAPTNGATEELDQAGAQGQQHIVYEIVSVAQSETIGASWTTSANHLWVGAFFAGS